jgi:ribonuclease T2
MWRIFLGLISSVWGGALLTNNNYDYFLFETEWKPTNCKFMNCPSGYSGEAFNIHGLWPERSDGSYPSNCGTGHFSVSSSLEAEMSQHWISDSEPNASFWEHEWSKHGTCVSASETSEEYCNSVIQLFLTVSPQSLLASHGITPSNTIAYPVSSIKEAFSAAVNISCHCNNNVCYFLNLEICVDKTLGLINCPAKSSNCGNALVLPAS